MTLTITLFSVKQLFLFFFRQSYPPDVPKDWTPIFKKEITLRNNVAGIRCNRKQFPISPAEALTAWKAQGSTLGRICVHLNSTKNPSTSLIRGVSKK